MFDQVTSFKKNMSEKSGSETYWISINKTNNVFDLPKSPSLQRKVVNVDDIPLKPPSTMHLRSNSFSNIKLSPILEETRHNLDKDHFEYSVHEFEQEKSGMAEKSEPLDNDILAGGDNEESISYIAFDRPEVNVVVCDQVNFYRTNTINTTSYVQSKTVNFQIQNTSSYTTHLAKTERDELENTNDKARNAILLPGDENNMDSDDSEGNWMGYKQAQF